MTGASSSRGGLFLSYAREDTDPARRIADALRGFGIEVWFDQSELRGGDEWDGKIKRQIRECALFVPVVSTNSRARGRGTSADMRRAMELDVANIRYLTNLISDLEEARRYDELAAACRKMAALRPDDFTLSFEVAVVSFHANGSTREAEEFVAHLSPGEAASHEEIRIRARWAATISDYPELVRLRHLQPYDEKYTPLAPWEQELYTAQVLFLTGDKAGATARLGRIPEDLAQRLEREPKNPRHLAFQAIVDLIQGRSDDAIRASERSVELIPASLDALQAPVFQSFRAILYDHTEHKDQALAEFARLLRTPGADAILSVYELKRDTLSSLHGDPRFEALLNDPAKNAPLF